ncbi:MAG TPA: helix-turn-helix domain-containing protein, partial [Candidatus Sulfotelmatobacter sp.]|nr:helix-turn-helix domain-containing protein [Candidatus Sulfotelmatobacter sp.]
MKNDLLTIQQAANYLAVSTRTLRRWESKGNLKSLRTVGNQRRYSKSELDILFKNPQSKLGHEPQADVTLSLQQDQKPQAVLSTSSVIPMDSLRTTGQRNENSRFMKNERSSFTRVLLSGILVSFILFAGLAVMIVSNQEARKLLKNSNAFLINPVHTKEQKQMQNVLATTDHTPIFEFQINIPSLFGKKTTFLDNVSIKKSLSVEKLASLSGGITTNNADVNAGRGRLTASNIVYSVIAGSNISISGDKQNPT